MWNLLSKYNNSILSLKNPSDIIWKVRRYKNDKRFNNRIYYKRNRDEIKWLIKK